MLLSKLKQQSETLGLDSLVASIGLDGELHITRLDGSALNTEEVLVKLKSGRRLNREIAIVWVPTEKVVMTDVMVPGKRKALWMAALPYALEEGLSEAVEHYHFVPYYRSAEGRVSVAIASHEDMKNWKRVIESYGLGHVHLVADCFRIQDNNATNDLIWHRLKEGNRCLVKVDVFHGFACNQAWYETLKGQMLNASETPASSITEIEVNPTSLLSSHIQAVPMVLKQSLSQLAYKANVSSNGSWYAWRWVGVLALGIMLVFLATTMLETQKLQQQTIYTKQKTTELFKTLFPENKRIVNIKSQTLTYLKQQGSTANEGAKLVSILQQVEPWFNQVKSVKVEKMQWQQSGHSKGLSLMVSAPSSADLQKVIALSKKQAGLQNNNQPGLVGSEFAKVSMRLTLKNVTAKGAQGVIYVNAN